MKKLLSKDFDPWYVMLSAPKVIKEKSNEFVERPLLPKKFINIDYKNIAKSAEKEAELIIRERWRELRILSPEEQVATILSSKNFRNGNSLGVKKYLIKTLQDSGDEIKIVLPSFPFKIPNPLKTWHHNLDAGEILCLKRLYLISFIIQELMDKPTKFVVISDGFIYSDICEIDSFEYKAYSQKAKDVINKMGISNNIEYVDMVDDVIGDDFEKYNQILKEVRLELKSWWDKNKDSDKVKYLISNMSSNIKTDDLDYSVLRAINKENMDNLLEEYLVKINERSSAKAFEFTAKLVTLRITDTVINKYKGCIRATVHPKKGQYGIHLVNKESQVFPWQGVVLQDKTGKFKTSSSQDAWQTAKCEVFDKDSGDFMYYSEMESPSSGDLL
ncbi:L-tyrosine/L-tryptophan isonitrile synthase family protein [Fructilactobacillus frigidiflavus]|uniref:L-tyrosine/L-tryptophan isonitrile synthase family protein n=1 Tax=Fructilactobacillus frigidiflavus TaxID=3242688 RepID=UPI0037564B01